MRTKRKVYISCQILHFLAMRVAHTYATIVLRAITSGFLFFVCSQRRAGFNMCRRWWAGLCCRSAEVFGLKRDYLDAFLYALYLW
jgi:hypothetical protein